MERKEQKGGRKNCIGIMKASKCVESKSFENLFDSGMMYEACVELLTLETLIEMRRNGRYLSPQL